MVRTVCVCCVYCVYAVLVLYCGGVLGITRYGNNGVMVDCVVVCMS